MWWLTVRVTIVQKLHAVERTVLAVTVRVTIVQKLHAVEVMMWWL